MNLKVLILSAIIGTAYAQSEKALLDSLNLPPELLNNLNETTLQEHQNKTTEVFKNKCEQNGGPEAFNNAHNAFNQLTSCLQILVNMEILQQELEEAKPNGMIDEVFKKYCLKKTNFMNCFTTMLDASKPCFTVKERDHLNTVYNVSRELADFVCFKDGDRIALFISEGGAECFQEKQSDLQKCYNQTAGQNANFDLNSLSPDNLPTLSFDEKQCKEMSVTQVCVVKVLETCQKPAAANIVDSLFKFLVKKTPCKAYLKAEENAPDSADVLFAKMATVAMGLLAVALV